MMDISDQSKPRFLSSLDAPWGDEERRWCANGFGPRATRST